MTEMYNNATRKRSSIQLTAPPYLNYRASIELPACPIPIENQDRTEQFGGGFRGGPPRRGSFNPWEEKADPNAPKDKFNFIRITLFVLGFTTMLPMTMLLTANEYWMYKFRDTDTPWTNYTASNRTNLQVNFGSYSTIAGIAPAVLFNLISTFIGHKVRMNIRARMYFFTLTAVFVANTIFTKLDTDSWQTGFYLLTMGSQVVLSFAGVLGIVILPITTKFPKKYLQTHLVGNGLAGLVTSTLRLISIVSSPSTTGSAYIYFGTATILMLMSWAMFEFMKINAYYKYTVTSGEKEETKKEANSVGTIVKVIRQVWPILVLNSLIILIPITPITTLVVSENQGSGNTWSDKYFVTVATYLIPAIGEIIGRVISNMFIRFINGKFMALTTLFRIVVFIPLIYMSNAQPRNHLPVWLTHDWEYMTMMFLHTMFIGFSMNLGMIWTTSLVPHNKMELGFRIVMMFMGALGSLSSPLSLVAVKII